MEWAEEWPDEWGILFTVYAFKGKFYGKVRLNKWLSFLQREGFPIKNKFKAAKMGPYDKNIDIQVNKLEKNGLIDIEEQETKHASPLVIYKQTKDGEKYTLEKILPLLNDIPDKVAFKLSFISAKSAMYTKTTKLIDAVHENLILDDYEEFLTELAQAQKKIEKKLISMEKEAIDYCQIYSDYLGFLEFTNNSLKNIIEKLSKSTLIGKNHVLFNSKELINRYNTISKNVANGQLKKCKQKNECLMHPCPHYDKLLRHRFRCIEFNSDLYNIQKAIDIRTTDFLKLLET